MRILLVDDDELLTRRLTNFLTSQHYAVDVASDGEAGWDYAQAADYDLIVLDVNLPRLNGVSLCKKLREIKCNSPILLLTAKGDSLDKVVGLDAGADDYLVKPCTLDELSARIRALLRRPNASVSPLLEWGNLRLDSNSCEVTYRSQLLALSPKEYALLELFLRNPQRVFSSSSILEHLWGFDDAPGEETIRTHIKRLRRKLKSTGAEDVIDTVYGMGYRLKPFTETEPTPPTEPPALVEPSAADKARTAAIALWDQFKAPILERMVSIDQAVAALDSGCLTDGLRQAALKDAHKLAGSLGMFGFLEGSRLSRKIEQELEASVDIEEADYLRSLVAALHFELQQTPHLSTHDLLTSLSEESLANGETSSPLSVAQMPSSIKVLAVDDDVLILEALRLLLSHRNIQPVTLSDPSELWTVLRREKPDLLILDVDLPHHNGIELCRSIRRDDAWSGLPILFVTAHRDRDTILQLYNAGADDYVAKPFTEAEIITRICNRLERNRQLQTWRKPSV